MSIPRGLSSPLATVFQPFPSPLCACALGTTTIAAITAIASSLLLCIAFSSVDGGGGSPLQRVLDASLCQ
jgi:hypothetical protein